MALDISDFLVLLLGNGLISVIVSIYFQRSERKSQFDFDARKIARQYYMKLYAHIGRVDERAKNYKDSLIEGGETEIFIYDTLAIEKHTSSEIQALYNSEYEEFVSYYINRLNRGYEIFIDDYLHKNLSKFWTAARGFYDDSPSLKDTKSVNEFNELAKKTTDYMEEVFGLKNRRLSKWEKLKKIVSF